MEPQIRRLLPRQVVDWSGSYSIQGEPEEHWGECRVIDISSGGAGLELLDTYAGVQVGKSVIIAVRLRGEIRDCRPRRGDRLRVGIQFVDVSERESEYLASIVEIGARW
jgi:hypothetical protein